MDVGARVAAGEDRAARLVAGPSVAVAVLLKISRQSADPGDIKVVAAIGLALALVALPACGRGGSPGADAFGCDPADAARPDEPRREVAGVTAPAVPRRSCTVPQHGCVAVPNIGRQAPPAPGVRVSRVTRDEIEIEYDVGSELGDCRPVAIAAAVYTTVSGGTPQVEQSRIGSQTGSIHIEVRHIPGMEKYGPPDMVFVSSYTGTGLRGTPASVRVPPPDGEPQLSDEEKEQLYAHREACRADIDDSTSCELETMNPTSGPVKAAPAEFSRSVQDSLAASGGMRIVSLQCFAGSRCNATFDVDGHTLGMSYRMEALVGSRPDCWELTAFAVTQAVPELAGLAAPLPTRGCAGS